MVNFIGIGAQKSGTSWVYACLYEHPEICAPVKEIHFFSRDRFENGKEWYEEHFKRCVPGMKCGEFSTSYLYSPEAPERIHALYPHAQVIAILRNPIARAISQYGNAIKAGEIDESITFESYCESERSVLQQGLYAEQLNRYLTYFDRSQLCILIYEDSKKDPKKFMETIYTFLGVDATFVPSMLFHAINTARVPKHIGIERTMHRLAEFLRKQGMDRFVHRIRQSGIPDRIRNLNTKKKGEAISVGNHDDLSAYFVADVTELSKVLGRDLVKEWNIKTL
jgi:hypothetical protein